MSKKVQAICLFQSSICHLLLILVKAVENKLANNLLRASLQRRLKIFIFREEGEVFILSHLQVEKRCQIIKNSLILVCLKSLKIDLLLVVKLGLLGLKTEAEN